MRCEAAHSVTALLRVNRHYMAWTQHSRHQVAVGCAASAGFNASSESPGLSRRARSGSFLVATALASAERHVAKQLTGDIVTVTVSGSARPARGSCGRVKPPPETPHYRHRFLAAVIRAAPSTSTARCGRQTTASFLSSKSDGGERCSKRRDLIPSAGSSTPLPFLSLKA